MSFLRETNTKCLVISGGLMGAYWVAPSKNMVVMAAIGVSSYAAIGWYDSIHSCNTKLVSYDGIYSDLFSWTKPQIGVVTNTYGGN